MIPSIISAVTTLALLVITLIRPETQILKTQAVTVAPAQHVETASATQSATKSETTVYEESLFTYIPTPTPLPKRLAPTVPTDPNNPNPAWGVAKPVGDGTYTIKIAYDGAMTSPSEFVSALNAYRSTRGAGALIWDDALGNYAAGRAQTFKSISKTDNHAGFNDFLNNQNGFATLKFSRLGENSYYGGPVTGTHVVEWVFAQSPGHNANQLDPSWTHIGVGVSETSIDIIFGGSKM